ncbi:MAG: DUF1232 domain-containing protein, partial [Planctomycetota bacterium]
KGLKLQLMGFLGKIGPIGRALAFWRILRDRSVPWWGKVSFIAASLGYVISPADLMPDIVFGIGWLDDLIILPIFAWLFGKKIPAIVRGWQERQRIKDQ